MRHGSLLQAGSGRVLLRRDAGPQRHGDRADHRRRQLRHRAHRAGRERRRHRRRRRRRQAIEGRGLHGRADAGGRPLRDRLRRARDGTPVRRRAHLQRQSLELRLRQPQPEHVGRARQRLDDHGLRRDLPLGRPAAPQRSLLLRAQHRARSATTSALTGPSSTRFRASPCGTSTPTATRSPSPTTARRRSPIVRGTNYNAGRDRGSDRVDRGWDGDRGRVRRPAQPASTTRASRSPSAVRWRARRPRSCRSPTPGSERLRRRDRARRAAPQRRLEHRQHRQPPAGRDDAGALSDPGADPVQPHRQRH